tara:strand:+ start:6258 stop:6692 length:435 start_codon:yes stop_codon:yes gene_type:complete
MAWPTNSSNIDTQHLDAGTDSPASARADLKTALDELANVIDGRNQASGVAGLDASSKISATQIPDEINSSAATDLTIDPTTGKVKLEEILNLKPQTTAQLNARTDQATGDVAFCSDGGGDSAGVGCIAVYDGADWRAIQLGSVL